MFVVAILSIAGATLAGGRGANPSVDLLLPLDPSQLNPPPLQFFDGQQHHQLPGTVTINGAPYICDVDRRTFRDGSEFAYHLQTAHGVPPAQVRSSVVVVDGRVHFPAQAN